MPMGIVSDREFDSELSNVKQDDSKPNIPVQNAEIIDAPSRGRGENNNQVPDGLRKLIGEESATNGRQSAVELASSFGISPSSVSAYGVGANSTSTYNERPNQSHINESKIKVQKRARNKLMSALSYITKDKLEVTNAKDLAGIAKDMSAVIKNMEPESEKKPNGDNPNSPTFVFYAPQFRKEENYEIVTAKE